MVSRKLKLICITLFVLAWINFVVFFVVASIIGGDAMNGKVKDGKYYVAHRSQYTEVSRPVFVYSRFHVYFVWILHPIGMLCLAYAILKEKGITWPKPENSP
jgi:hypothetical protein